MKPKPIHFRLYFAILSLLLLSPRLITSVRAQQEICTQPFQPVATPLTELGNNPYVRMDGQTTTFTGGLYPDGNNTRPAQHEAAGLAEAAKIVPLNKKGQPDPQGSIVMLSIGMSNASSEFNNFMKLAHKNPEINPQLVLINGAQGGQTAEKWVEPDSLPWQMAQAQLNRHSFTAEQVQVAWVKETLTRGGDFPIKTQTLEAYLEAIAHNLKINFPNIKIAYFSSRTRSYAYWRGISPEPVAYETGFAVKWLIEKQIKGDPALNFDPARGEVKAPYLSWGPYLWIDGTNPRSDGRVWTAEDMTADCTHPSPSGNQKVAEMLMEFFMSDTLAASWFPVGAHLPPTQPPTPIPTDVVAVTPTLVQPLTAVASLTPVPLALLTEQTSSTPVAGPTVTSASPAANTRWMVYGVLIIASLGVGLAASWFIFHRR